MSPLLVYLIPVLFICIHFLEFSAILARIAGVISANNLLGYSIQQAVFVGTRLFIVLLLPFLGLVVDLGISSAQYQRMAIFALLGAAAISGCVYLFKVPIINYYGRVIENYLSDKSFAMSFFTRRKGSKPTKTVFEPISVANVFRNPKARKIIIQSAAVFGIYSTGIFLSFYFALQIPEYRASISQLSGIINSLGTIILTFFIEPRISRGIDQKDPNAPELILGLLIGRFIGVAFLSQAILLTAFLVQ